MKSLNGYYQLVIFAIITMSFSACSNGENPYPEPAGTGFLKIDNLNVDIKTTTTTTSKTPIPNPTAGEIDTWEVQIIDSQNVVVETYPDYSDIPSTIGLVPGDYTVRVHSENEGVVGLGFTNAFFEGRSAFTITEGNTTSVDVTAKVSNARVTVQYSSQLSAEGFTDYSTTVSSASGNLIFSMVETQSGFFPIDEDLTVQVTLNHSSGMHSLGPYVISGNTTFDPNNESAPHHILNVSYTITGQAIISVNDVEVNTEDINHPISNRTYKWIGGGPGSDFYSVSNWLALDGITNLPATAFDTPIAYNLLADDSATNSYVGNLRLANGFSLTLNAGKLFNSGTESIASPAGSTAELFLSDTAILDGDILENLSVSMTGGTISLYGDTIPSLVNTTVDMQAGSDSKINFFGQDIGSVTANELGSITVDGAAAADGVNVTIAENGNNVEIIVN